MSPEQLTLGQALLMGLLNIIIFGNNKGSHSFTFYSETGSVLSALILITYLFYKESIFSFFPQREDECLERV